MLPVVVKDLKAINIKDADDRVAPVFYLGVPLQFYCLVYPLHNPAKHAVVNRLNIKVLHSVNKTSLIHIV